jgi:hypothetical protein
MARPKIEVLEGWQDQIRFLRKSCDAYDGGDESEGYRLAAPLVICLSSDGQKSLLDMLFNKTELMFYSSVAPLAANVLSDQHPMVGLRLSSDQAKYLPMFQMVGSESADWHKNQINCLKWNDWWSKRKILKTCGRSKRNSNGEIVELPEARYSRANLGRVDELQQI